MNHGRHETPTGTKRVERSARGSFRGPCWPLALVALVLLGFFVFLDSKNVLIDQAQTIGDLGVFAIAVLGLTLAVWRFGIQGRQASAAERLAEAATKQAKVAEEQGKTAEVQANTATEQTKAATKHADAAQYHARVHDRALLHDRYQRAARKLGDRIQAVRIGGVYLLDRLAREQTEAYHLEVMRLFASFVRHQENRPPDDGHFIHGRLRADVQAVMTAVGSRELEQLACEKEGHFVLDLAGSNLQGADLRSAHLVSANLERVRLERADLTGARLDCATVTGAVLATPGAQVIGLTQEQLDSCEPSDAPEGCDLLGLEWRRDAVGPDAR